MAIAIPADEKVLERLSAQVGGKLQELVLTDKAIYYESQRSPVTTWLSALLMPLAILVGLGVFYRYLQGGRLFVRHTLERIDAVTTRRVPLAWIANLGGLLALIFGFCFFLEAHRWTGGDVVRSLWWGYGAAVVICLIAAILLVRWQLSSLSVNALNGTFTFETYASYEEMQRVQDRIWQARAEFLSRLPALAAPALGGGIASAAVSPPPPAPPPATPAPANPSAQQAPTQEQLPRKSRHRSRRR
jgi:hypothetical protein